ncbi:MAG TPA: porin [Myxococcaceae bacterium]|nr:porin [Myxococcaceae bacterium]
MIEILRLRRIVVALVLAFAGSTLAADPPAEPAPAPAANPIAELPKKIAVGTNGLFQPGLLLQGWFVFDQTDVPANTFRIRRAEVSAKGEIVPGMVGYNVMFDPSRVREPTNTTLTDSNGDTVTVKTFPGAASAFQDVYLTFLSPVADVSVGQFKIPVSWEGFNSSAKLILPERSLVGVAYGDKRDIGIRVTKTFKNWMYSAGVFNGAVSNNLDTNNSKDLGLRLEVYPIEGLTLAGVGYASIGERLAPTTRDRWEFDARYERGPLLFQSEYIHAYDGGGAGRVEAQGFYGVFAYLVTDKIQPVIRVGYLDPNVARDLDPVADKGADEGWEFNAGVNYYLQKHEAKLQLAYQRVQYDVKTPLNEVILAAQVWF